jgi:hypothetical protein
MVSTSLNVQRDQIHAEWLISTKKTTKSRWLTEPEECLSQKNIVLPEESVGYF